VVRHFDGTAYCILLRGVGAELRDLQWPIHLPLAEHQRGSRFYTGGGVGALGKLAKLSFRCVADVPERRSDGASEIRRSNFPHLNKDR